MGLYSHHFKIFIFKKIPNWEYFIFFTICLLFLISLTILTKINIDFGKIKPPKHWKWYSEDCFEEGSVKLIARSPNKEIKKANFKNSQALQYMNEYSKLNIPMMYASSETKFILKGLVQEYEEEHDSLSHWVNCSLIPHQNLSTSNFF